MIPIQAPRPLATAAGSPPKCSVKKYMIAAFSTSSTGYAKTAFLLVQSASASAKVFASGVSPAGTGKNTYFEPT